MSVFVTGATGFLGRYLARGLINAGEDVVLLVRSESPEHARERVRAALDWLDPLEEEAFQRRVTVCPGSIDHPGLGLAPGDRELVLSRCSRFLHAAASVRFDLSLDEARRINVDGTRAVLRLATQSRIGVDRFDYVSTAFVAGRRTGLVLEDELDGGHGFKNTYEQSKFEAEECVRQARAELPIAIFRPSIVVGEHLSGRTPAFNTLYWPIKIYALGLWRIAVGKPDARVDVVPVDFVRDALLTIRRRADSVGRCFHLAAGPEGDAKSGELAAIVESFFPDRKPVRFVDADRWVRATEPLLRRIAFGRFRQIVEAGRFYVPYFVSNPRFDTTQATAFLANTGVCAPDVRTYFRTLLEYGVKANWGRRSDPAIPTSSAGHP